MTQVPADLVPLAATALFLIGLLLGVVLTMVWYYYADTEKVRKLLGMEGKKK